MALVAAAASLRMRVASGRVAAPLLRAQGFRGVSGIKIMEDAHKAQENLYWAHEDERLLKKMIENNADLNPELQGISGMLDDGSSTADKVKMIFMKHGIPPVNKKLIDDLVQLASK
eukprot:TRINITY_DN41517_c0_g1_i1.p1 TRINITY_DN41517_c0_g1~~TRINITY_DN41517_c0_g1_i1.p1  ORF type:complete len:134 (+),score=40.26 TRINITY_DN41517_c0_g1_i1:56-403(+)